MTWLLHLSDLHLGEPDSSQLLDDEKLVLPQPDRETTARILDRTLERLGKVVETEGRPEVAVISGDLTNRCGADGFEEFAELIQRHRAVLPKDLANVVVVPGNHDVDWSAGPGTPERYAAFVKATRAVQVATPLLDGVDFRGKSATGGGLMDPPPRPHGKLPRHPPQLGQLVWY